MSVHAVVPVTITVMAIPQVIKEPLYTKSRVEQPAMGVNPRTSRLWQPH